MNSNARVIPPRPRQITLENKNPLYDEIYLRAMVEKQQRREALDAGEGGARPPGASLTPSSVAPCLLFKPNALCSRRFIANSPLSSPVPPQQLSLASVRLCLPFSIHSKP